jgi:AcrR family transcriptional regulator
VFHVPKPSAARSGARRSSRPGAPAEGRELRARGQRTVRKLLDAGIEVFGRKGYHSARVDDIVKVAKTSHGTFYLYFANKEDLFRALTHDVAEEMAALVESLGALTPDEDGYTELRAWLAKFAELHRRYGPVIRAWTEAEIDASTFGRAGVGVLGDLAATLGARIAASPGIDVDPRVAALALVAMIERSSYYKITGQLGTADDDGLIDTQADIAFAALFGGGVRDGATSRR